MPRRALTDRRPERHRRNPADVRRSGTSTLKGFGVRVSPAGHQDVRVRLPHARRPPALENAGPCRQRLARARSPTGEGRCRRRRESARSVEADRRLRAARSTLRDVAERWMADHISPATASRRRRPDYRQALDAYILPLLGNVPMADISQADAMRLHESLRTTPTQANRVLRALSSLLTWSMQRQRPLSAARSESVFRHRAVPRTETHALSDAGRVRESREGAAHGDNRPGHSHGDSVAAADRCASGRNREPAMGVRRSEGGGAALAGLEDGTRRRSTCRRPRSAC